ncbi:MAG: hypothetical protein M1829_000030 [Trizodia sp. TS-e1964]|nr:MAG: hypothetical protein M1829_000030 [Trizodia sp. TS-e1964]
MPRSQLSASYTSSTMADSDGEYIDNPLSDDEEGHNIGRTAQRSANLGPSTATAQPKARWEDIQRSWDTVVEGADGSISNAVTDLLEAGKRKRLLRDTTPLQRGIIRHLLLVLDMSQAMSEKDMRPTRYLVMLRYAQDFVTEFFEQNPISQLGIIGMRDGLALRVSDLSGNPTDHIAALESFLGKEPEGAPSLQNALEMARGALFNTPSHGTREVLIVLGALLSSDPGDIHRTIDTLVADKIRVAVVGLAAQVAICKELCAKTNAGDDSVYGVALNEGHFRDLLLETTTPPITRSTTESAPSLLMMGFPSRTVEAHASLCACHSKLTRGGYLCSRCSSKVCSLPSECPACGLTLILSTHLARSYHHLFPLKNWVEVPWSKADGSTACFSCMAPFPPVPEAAARGGERRGVKVGATSESSRYECTVCHRHFCVDCDVFCHEVVHNCPGCQSMVVR